MGGGHCEPPHHDNNTVQEIQRRLDEQERKNREAEERRRKEDAERRRRDEEERRRREEEDRARSKREEEDRRRREEEEARRRREEEERRRREEEDRRRRREEEEARRRREEEDRRRRDEEEARRRREEEARMQATLKKLEEQANEARRREAEAIEARKREEQFRKDMEEKQRRSDEERAAFQRQLEEQAIETKRREEEALEAQRREEQSRKEAEEQRRQAEEERAAYERRLEEQAIEARRQEEEAIEARRREEESRREAEEQRRQAEEERIEFERRLEEQALEAQRQEEEAAEARRREEQSRREAEEQQHKAEEERIALQQQIEESEEKLSKGIRPVVWPTKEEVAAAKAKVQYDPERLHFAVCGPSGSGKSSLINSFRGLKRGDPGAADVGIVETTLEVTRYADPRTELPYPRFIWCDVPGAGTFKIPAWQYFNQQGLFIFDFIVLVYDIRFSQIDADILENCRRFKIPALIVRSKASQQIRNLMDDEGCEYEEARDLYVKTTRANLRSNLLESGLWKPGEGEPPQCYIVSRECVYDYIHSTEEDRREKKTKTKIPKEEKKGGKLTHKYIDEVRLIHDLLQTAYDRRYTKPERNRSSGMISSVTMAASKLGISVPTNR